MPLKYVFSKLISTLNELSNEELGKLVYLLKKPETKRSLAQLIEKTLELRKIEQEITTGHPRKSNKSKISRAKIDISRAPTRTSLSNKNSNIKSPENLREMISKTLEDRDLFPSTRHVIEAAKHLLHINLDYNTYRKSGRKPIINKCLDVIDKMSLRAQLKIAEGLFKMVPDQSRESREYRELFRILTRHE